MITWPGRPRLRFGAALCPEIAQGNPAWHPPAGRLGSAQRPGGSPMGQPLRSITIVGGGTAGWLAAAFLNRFCQSKDQKYQSKDQKYKLKITLIESPAIPIVGVGEASLPGMVLLLNQLGVSETEFFKATDATFKVAAHFIDWNRDDKGRPIEFLNILNAP